MTTPQLIKQLEEEEGPPQMNVARELLERQPKLSHDSTQRAYSASLTTIKRSLSSPSPETKEQAFKTLLTFPEFQKDLKEDLANLKEIAKQLNDRVGSQRYRIEESSDEIRIRTKYVLIPLKVQPPQ